VTAQHHGPADSSGLRVEKLTVRFGGLVAVNAMSLHAPLGKITGLIGPNGAGKTTTFNSITGLQEPTEGSVFFAGRDVTKVAPQRRAQMGMGRTFQRMELFDSLTVRENVDLGREAGLAGSSVWHLIKGRRRDRAEIRRSTSQALDLCGISHLAAKRPADLSTGQRRLVELARVIAGDFTMLLLDEPSSGLDRTETERFGEILMGLAQRGIGILIVEHDMALVMSCCHYLYVLDFGTPIFEGTPAEVAASSEVRAAYLGSEEVGQEATMA
jgi:ABC-type branched-subunit amino acid transport system ATPase component